MSLTAADTILMTAVMPMWPYLVITANEGAKKKTPKRWRHQQ